MTDIRKLVKMDFLNAPQIVDYDDDEVDMFAELGLTPQVNSPTISMPEINSTVIRNDPLAAFMDDDDEAILETDDFGFIIEDGGILENQSEELSMPPASDETIAELLQVLVKKELRQRKDRGEEWLSELPAEARANIESAKVIRDSDAYHLSLIIDMVGSGPVRPFATVLSTDNGFELETAPSSIPSAWMPLYNVLRDLLVQAMNTLSSTRISVNHNA
jgi:hypothetical protein